MIKVSGLVKKFHVGAGEVGAVQGVSFEVKPGARGGRGIHGAQHAFPRRPARWRRFNVEADHV